MKSLILISLMLIQFGLFCQNNSQNSEFKKMIKKTIKNNKSEFQLNDTIYFEIPSFLKSNINTETYFMNNKKEIVICLLNPSEVFESNRINFYYGFCKFSEKKEIIQVYKITHPRVGVGRKMISKFIY